MIRVHSRRIRIERLRARIHDEASIVGSETRWLLAAAAWITLLYAGLTVPLRLDLDYYLGVGIFAATVWFAAFDRRPWLRSLLSTILVIGAIGTMTLETSGSLAPGVVFPGIGLFLLTAFRL